MSALGEFLQKSGLTDPKIINYMTQTLQLERVSDFAHYWTTADFEKGVQTDVVQHVADVSLPSSKLQIARLRAAWKLAQNQPAVPIAFEAVMANTLAKEPGVGPSGVDMASPMSIVIFGATGDLAKKKLYPALYQLMFGCPDAPLIPTTANIVGYGRSPVELSSFLKKQCANVKGAHKDEFLKRCSFFSGAYDAKDSYSGLDAMLSQLEGGNRANRIFFFSVPPTLFGDICSNVKAKVCAPKGGFTRLLVEKPFGRDSRSFAKLNAITSSAFREDQLFRIDHYLGKEVVLNLVALRFGNQLFEGLWDKEHIESVQIVFKEDLGTGGRGGYFDNFGIIRDILQNHLLQIFLWLAMEPPASLEREAVAARKCELLRAIQPATMKDCFLGQFGPNRWSVKGKTHEEPGYLDDKTVPAGSKCPTYAAAALFVDNERWKGVPFLFRAGKGLDERLAEVRVSFKKKDFNALVPGSPNELVMRIQPDEAIYLTVMNKVPGWRQQEVTKAVLDMSYKTAFGDAYVADAYERMFLNAAKGDGSLFVGSDELTEAWRIFTPLLDEIESSKPTPVVYPFGVRVPDGMDNFAKRYGITMEENWEEYLVLHKTKLHNLRELFDELDKDKSGRLTHDGVQELARRVNDGRQPTDAQVLRIMERLDADGDGTLDFGEVQQAVESMCRCSASTGDWHSQWARE